MTESAYVPGFYKDRRAETAHAARQVLGIVMGILEPRAIADVGCGTGTWLAEGLALGATTAFGIEGDWVTPGMLDDARIGFFAHDLEQSFVPPDAVDLVISLEVAEHLSPRRAEGFVADLVRSSPAVLFGAAIPGQGGVNHLNERWQSYWSGLFAGAGYRAFDCVRPAIWGDASIPPWYRQNIVLYLKSDHPAATGLIETSDLARLDLVHPELWARANRELTYAGALPESDYLRQQAAQQQQ